MQRFLYSYAYSNYHCLPRENRDHDRLVVRFTNTYAISAYHY
jgi:hypothetical protein